MVSSLKMSLDTKTVVSCNRSNIGEQRFNACVQDVEKCFDGPHLVLSWQLIRRCWVFIFVWNSTPGTFFLRLGNAKLSAEWSKRSPTNPSFCQEGYSVENFRRTRRLRTCTFGIRDPQQFAGIRNHVVPTLLPNSGSGARFRNRVGRRDSHLTIWRFD